MAIRPDLHLVEVFRVIGSQSARFAVCKCGWKGPQRATLECVLDDALQHEESDMELTMRKPRGGTDGR